MNTLLNVGRLVVLSGHGLTNVIGALYRRLRWFLARVAIVSVVSALVSAREAQAARCPSLMKWIPGRQMTLGDGQVSPIHLSALQSFCIDITEVTKIDYLRASLAVHVQCHQQHVRIRICIEISQSPVYLPLRQKQRARLAGSAFRPRMSGSRLRECQGKLGREAL